MVEKINNDREVLDEELKQKYFILLEDLYNTDIMYDAYKCNFNEDYYDTQEYFALSDEIRELEKTYPELKELHWREKFIYHKVEQELYEKYDRKPIDTLKKVSAEKISAHTNSEQTKAPAPFKF